MKENNYTQNFTYKSIARKNNFTLENIIMYSPKKDRSLSTSKKEIKNNGIGNQPNPKKISTKYTQCTLVV